MKSVLSGHHATRSGSFVNARGGARSRKRESLLRKAVIESLETRMLLSNSYTVCDTSDSPTDPQSLRYDIAQANTQGGGTISFSPTAFPAGSSETIDLTGSPLNGIEPSLSVSGTTITATWPTSDSFSALAMSADGASSSLGNQYWTPIVTNGVSGGNYVATLTGLTPGTKYDFTLISGVSFVNTISDDPEDGYEAYAFGQANARTDGTAPVAAPAAPSRIMTKVVTGNAVTDNRVQVAWTNSSNNESGFKVERRDLTGDYPNVWNLLYNTDADVTKETDIGVTPGNYQYRITAYNSGGANSTTVNVGVWPPGHLEALDGTTDTPVANTLIYRFSKDYQQSDNYFSGVNLVQWSGAPVERQISDAYTDATNFYQDPVRRSNNVPLDIVGYSRGAFASMVLMFMLDNVGIPILSTKHIISVPIYAPFGLLILGYKTEDIYQYYKPKIRFAGLISPVGQANAIAELAALASVGLIQFDPGYNTEIPAGTDVFAAYYPDAGILGLLGILQNPTVLPQLPTVPGAFIPPADDHVSIAQDQLVEVAMWDRANGDNVPIPQRPSDFDPGGI